MKKDESIHILGLGNILCGDDGFGCHAINILQENYKFPSYVQIMDVGNQGQLLPSILAQAKKLLLIDAADFNAPAGSVFQKSFEEIPAWLAKGKLSAHQGSFAEAFALSQLCGKTPKLIHLIAFQPVILKFGSSPSPQCQDALSIAVHMALDVMRSWNIDPLYCPGGVSQMNRDLKQSFSEKSNS